MVTIDSRVQELIAYTKQKVGLQAYSLHVTDIHLEQTLRGAMPVLSMEWFPNDREERTEEGLNPPGTAVVEVEIRSRQLRKVIFTNGLTYANELTFNQNDLQKLIQWIEQESGLIHEKHFHLNKQDGLKYIFQSSYEGIPLSPSGHIQVELDHGGRLIFFSIYGEFPNAYQIQAESYSLTMDKEMEQLAFDQFKLVSLPLFEQQAWQTVYGIEEMFITHDKQKVIPCSMHAREEIDINQVMEWETPIDRKFEGKPLFSPKESLSWDEALTLSQVAKSFSLSEQEQSDIVNKVLHFLRMEFAKDSGQWLLKSIFPIAPHVIAELVPYPDNPHLPQRKLRVFLTANNYEVVNYMDKDMFVSLFDANSSPDEPVITREEAFAQIKDKIELTPVYVYDFSHQAYRLCGKIDCKYAVLGNGKGIIPM